MGKKFNKLAPELSLMSEETYKSVEEEVLTEPTTTKEVVRAERGEGETLQAPKGNETKTKRVQLVFRPTTHKNACKYAKTHKLSLNELCHVALEEYMNNHK